MKTSPTVYDVTVIGAGPAGYACALRAAELGLKTLCIDSWCCPKGESRLGGSHLNAGSVATIALLESAKIYHTLTHDLETHGIHVSGINLDIGQMVARKDGLLKEISDNMVQQLNRHHIDLLHAKAKLLSARLLEVVPVGNPQDAHLVKSTHIVLATGSSPVKLTCAPIDNEFIIDSNTALNLKTVPQKLAIIGAGVVGVELASIWQRLGSETILLEAQETFLSLLDTQIAEEAYRIYSSQGLDMRLGARVTATQKTGQHITVNYQDRQGTHSLTVDKLIVAPGRKPNSDNLSAPEADLLLDENGYVHVDENCRTNLPGVYAIGDLTLLGPMLAQKGITEGVFVAEQIAGLHDTIDYSNLPSVIYTDPEISWVGQNEQALTAMGENIVVSTVPFSGNARAVATGNTQGMVKIITHAENDTILGVHIIGTSASELITEAVLAMEFSASSEDLVKTIHARPTLSETLHETALNLKNKAIR